MQLVIIGTDGVEETSPRVIARASAALSPLISLGRGGREAKGSKQAVSGPDGPPIAPQST